MTRHLEPTGRHRAEVRPRYGRIATLGSSVAVVLIAVLGAAGALPSLADNPPQDDPSLASGDGATGTNADVKTSKQPSSARSSGTGSAPDPETQDQPDASEQQEQTDQPEETEETQGDDLEPVDPGDTTRIDTALPASSGTGKRVVYSEGRQRVWLVTENEKVRRTYLVSGSAYDNLEPGTFQVYSRDKNAVGIDDSGTMNFFVRFTQGDSGAAIGFHDIPIDAGLPVQALSDLGIPLSHGCVRQKREDAVALWKFAPIGTTVVVTT